MATMYPSQKAGLTKTTIWTNNSPSSSFPSTTITVSSSFAFSNFDYLEFTFKGATSVSGSAYEMSFMVPTDQFVNSTFTKHHPIIAMAGYGGSNYYCRRVKYISDTSLQVYGGSQIGGTNTTTDLANLLYIKGVKI